jgi:hypothetical protein
MLLGTSENAQRFGFDLRPKHGVQDGSRHYIGFCAEDVAYLLLDIDQLNQTEAWVVGIEKEIDIAVRPGVLPGNGAKQEECDPGPMKFVFMGAKRLDDVVAIHWPSPNLGISAILFGYPSSERSPSMA